MKKQLPATTVLYRSRAWRMSTGLYILLLAMWGSAYSQPVMLSGIPKGSKNFVSINSRLFFSSGDSLFTAAPTSAATFVYKTGEPIVGIYNLTVGSSFFLVTQSSSGQRLWRSDGTAANTAQVTNQTAIKPLLVYHGQLFLQVNNTASGSELWKVDAGYNASLVKDINPGPGNGFVGDAAVNNDVLYLLGNTGSGKDLWKSDGTSGGTVLSVDLDDTEYSNSTGYYGLTSANNLLFFTREYNSGEYDDRTAELWKSDGTAGGTLVIARYTGYTYAFVSHITPFQGKVYFFKGTGDPIYAYLMVTDGTAAGTHEVERVSIDGGVNKLINAGSYLVYYATSQGFTNPIRKYDGTTASTVHDWSYYWGGSDALISLTVAGGRAFFIDDVNAYEWPESSLQLWQADLAAGTDQPVEDIYHINLNNSGNIVASGNSIFFTRADSYLGPVKTLWYYNPDAPPSLCGDVGSIQREKWDGITGYSISSIPVNTNPSSITTHYSFDAPQNDGDNYGIRMRGYVCVPQTGNYVFYISSDDNSELWLSTDDNPANKKLIASSKWTNYNEWTKYPTQQSANIPLVSGQRYYIEALLKESAGADHLTVGWKLPDGTLERPIQGNRLIPFKRGIAPTVTFTQPANGSTFTAPADITFSATAQDTDGSIAKIAFYSNGNLLTEDFEAPYGFTWYSVPAGNYSLEARAYDNEGNTASAFNAITVSPTCSGTGRILEEMWVNAPGIDVRTFDFSTPPNGGTQYRTVFETPQYYADNYARRMRGWICVPQDGNYTFWISTDDFGELYLSTDDTEANKKLIASVYAAAPKFRVYDKYPSQKSALIPLKAGYKYYIEARQKEATGNDFISVGWQLPDGTLERPIAGSRLIPVVPAPNNPPSITITSPANNQHFTSPASVRIAADVTDPDGVKSVQFDVVYGGSSTRLATFTAPPYEYTWNNVPSGSYQLIVSADDNLNSGTGKSIVFSVDNTACSGTGSIAREIWTNISGTSVSSIPVNSSPNTTVTLTSFATPNYYANNYGSRIRGYICAPATGVYTFWISSDDDGELWLSDNDDPATKRRIAYVNGHTDINQWNKYSTQVSIGTINLVQGQRYYIEVLHKEADGGDHVEVGWQLPSGTLERPIPGNRLIPFENPEARSATASADVIAYSPEENETISLYPNPAVSGRQLVITRPGGTQGDMYVEIVSVTGVSVQKEILHSTGEEVTIELSPSLAAGMYLVRIADDKKRWTNKLQVNR